MGEKETSSWQINFLSPRIISIKQSDKEFHIMCISLVTLQRWDGSLFTDDFGVNFPALDPQFVDLGLGNVSPLLGLLQLVLELAEFGEVDVGLFLL